MQNVSPFQFKRFDLSEDRSLRPYSAADELLLQFILNQPLENQNIALINDRFGFLTCHLQAHKPLVVTTHKSQEKAISANLKLNNLPAVEFHHALQLPSPSVDVAGVKIPKSLALFELFLVDLVQNSCNEITILCSFMTRHFTPKLLEISQKYFTEVHQSKAVKKARVLTLSGKKNGVLPPLTKILTFQEKEFTQYLGVFSSNHIDYATQYLLQHMDLSSHPETIIDLASGNGIIASQVHQILPKATIHLVDDSILAVESAKMNISGDSIFHHYDNSLGDFSSNSIDFIITNPPFHFEYEINIQIPIALFKECHGVLSPGGQLQVVANTHLNYKTHLSPLFSQVNVLAENSKFIVYQCIK